MAGTIDSKGLGHEEKGEEAGIGNSLERTWPLRTWQGPEPVCGKECGAQMSPFVKDGFLELSQKGPCWVF